MKRTPRAVGAAILTAGVTAALLAVATGSAIATPSTSVVISEVYGGGGNSGALLTNDFIELQNVGSSAADLTGWAVQYISASPGPTTTWQVTNLVGSIPAGAHFLIQEAAGSTPSGALPTRT